MYAKDKSATSPSHLDMSGNAFFHPAYRDAEQVAVSSSASTWPSAQAAAAAAAATATAAAYPAQPQQQLPMLTSPSSTPSHVSNYSSPNVLPYLYLLNRDLWVKFNRHGNEMIVTKQGRRMFPSLIVKIAGLQPHAAYHLYVEIVQADPHQWKFTNGRWMANGIADIDPPEQPSPNAIYHHPESPCSGAEWMSRKIDFCSMKLTNDRTTTSGHIVLNSMRKYVPRIHVIEMPIGAGGILSPNQLMLGVNGLIDSKTPHWTFTFPETAFIAVTTYQNPVVTQLKIENNPFAKGFRDSDRDSRPITTQAAPPPPTDVAAHAHRHRARASPPPNLRANTSSAGGGSSDSSSPLAASELRLQQQSLKSQVSSSFIRHAATPSQSLPEVVLNGDNLFTPGAPRAPSWGWPPQSVLEAGAHNPIGIYSPVSPASGQPSLGLLAPQTSSPASAFSFGQNTPPGSGNSVVWPQSGYPPGVNQFAVLGPGLNNPANSSSCALAAAVVPPAGSMATSSMMQTMLNAADPAFTQLTWTEGGAAFYQ